MPSAELRRWRVWIYPKIPSAQSLSHGNRVLDGLWEANFLKRSRSWLHASPNIAESDVVAIRRAWYHLSLNNVNHTSFKELRWYRNVARAPVIPFAMLERFKQY